MIRTSSIVIVALLIQASVHFESIEALAAQDRSLSLELGYYTQSTNLNPSISVANTDNTLHLISPLVRAQAPIGGFFALEALWGLTFLTTSNELVSEDSGFMPLNPYLAAYITPKLGPASIKIGFGITAPVADTTSTIESAAYYYANGIRGSWNPWIYRPDTFALVLPAQIKLNLLLLEIMAEGALFELISTSDNGEDFFGIQLALQAMMNAGPLGYGLRIQGVRLEGQRTRADLTLRRAEDFQISLEPLVVLNLMVIEAYARFTLNLNEPYGFAFDDNRVWGFHIGIGFGF